MTIAGEANIQTARTTFETETHEAFQRRNDGIVDVVAKTFDGSDGQEIDISAPGAVPAFERWVGDAVFRDARVYHKTLPLDTYKAGLKLKRTQVQYDRSGVVAETIRAFTGDVEYLPEMIAFQKLDANPVGLDGVALLSASHPHGTANNLGSAFSEANVRAGITAMRKFKDEYNIPLKVNPTVLVVPPDLEQDARQAFDAELQAVAVGTAGAINSGGIGAAARTNIYKGEIGTIIVTPWLTSTSWFLMDPRFKPVALGRWGGGVRVAITDALEGEHRQRRDEFLYGVEEDIAAVGYQHIGLFGYVA